jgi:hypothetical protein
VFRSVEPVRRRVRSGESTSKAQPSSVWQETNGVRTINEQLGCPIPTTMRSRADTSLFGTVTKGTCPCGFLWRLSFLTSLVVPLEYQIPPSPFRKPRRQMTAGPTERSGARTRSASLTTPFRQQHHGIERISSRTRWSGRSWTQVDFVPGGTICSVRIGGLDWLSRGRVIS